MNTCDYWQYQLALQLSRIGMVSSCFWRPFSRLMVVRDFAGWSLDADALALKKCCRQIGLPMASGLRAGYSDKQVLFFTDQFALLKPEAWRNHRLAFAYFHGHPGTGVEEFDAVYDCFKKNHERFSRVQVSHSEMRDVLLETGVAAGKVRMIPIAVDVSLFQPASTAQRMRKRRELGIPESAFVVGSFQKDGVGWGEGNEPKLIKGPDVFVDVLTKIKARIPELFVLLSGPARGYVMQRLAAAGIPWRHVFFKHFSDLPPLYHALDAYLVSSRQEGGPKAVLESMASGIPLVTTRVGQAMDLVDNGSNAFMSDVNDCDRLAGQLLQVYEMPQEQRAKLCATALQTAHAHSWYTQGVLWKDFFAGVIE